jgi:glycosyltransferase involved in cell wall biosynthesis
VDVLLVAHGYPPDRRGGTELLTAGLAGELARAGHGVRALAAADVVGEPRTRDTMVDGIPVRLLERPVPPDYRLARAEPWAQRQLELLIEEEGPDVVHVQHTLFLGPEVIGAASRRAPTVVSLHDFWAQCPLVHTGPRDHHPLRGDWWGAACFVHSELRHPVKLLGAARRGRLGATLRAHLERPGRFRRALGAADAIVVPSAFLRDSFVRFGVPESRIDVIPNPVVVAPSETGTAAPVRFGYVGALAPHKGVHVLLDAFAAAGDGAELHVFGAAEDPAYAERLRQRVGGNVVFHGAFDGARRDEVYGSFDVLVVPSLVHETFSLVTLEAQTAGKPVIASRVGALPEVVHDRVNGRLVRAGDGRSLAGALKSLRDPEAVRRLRPDAAPGVLDLPAYADRLARLYERVRERRSRRP